MARRGAEPGSNGKLTSSRKSDRFLAGLAHARTVVLVSHVHPDPDSLGSMLGIAHLVEKCLDRPVMITRDGAICRAENRALVSQLRIQLEPIEEFTFKKGDALVMVDSQPNTGRHNFDPSLPIYAVLDHHDTPGDLEDVTFVDVRKTLGSTCSLVCSYLMEQEVDIPQRLATALIYGIESELQGYPREAHPLDETSLQFLYPLVNKDLLARIRHARQPQAYFECMLHALQNSFIYDRLIISWVNDLTHPDLAAEVVDFLIRFEEVDWAFCGGVYQDKMVLSARTIERHAAAGEMLRQVVSRMGKAGGHGRRAGGTVYLPSTAASAVEQVQTKLRRRLLRVLRIEECRGQRLVPRRELLQNLQA